LDIFLQDNSAVGNRLLVHRDVLNVSCKKISDLSPWHGIYREQDSLTILTGAPTEISLLVVNNVAGIHD